MNKSIKIIIKWVAAPLLAAWLFYSLYQQVIDQPDLESSLQLIRTAPFGPEGWKFWTVIVLAFVNWGIEARKWQLLLVNLQPMRFLTALKSVLCGVTLSLNIPNRMGEYGGRILFIEEGKRLNAVSLSIAGGISQLIVTVLMGGFGLIFLVLLNDPAGTAAGLSLSWLKFLAACSFVAGGSLLLLFFRLDWLTYFLERLPYVKRFAAYAGVLNSFDAKILLRLLYLSLLRYIVFGLQYIFMLQLLNVENNWWQSFWLITVLFWVMAIIPSFAIAELGIKGTIAKLLFGYTRNIAGVLAVTFGIWFINLFIPALIGSLLILSIKTAK